MNRLFLASAIAMAAMMVLGKDAFAQKLPPPGFHHLQINSTDPDAAIAFFTRHFPSTSRTVWGGMPALASPNHVLILFNKVAAPAPIEPQSAIWHFGWHVANLRQTLAGFRRITDLRRLPLYTGVESGAVDISADTYPGAGGILGLTQTQLAAAKARGDAPGGGANGFGYLRGPDNTIIEYQGAQPVERMNHVHMYQDEVFCALIWYQKHLNAPGVAGRVSDTPLDETNCKTARGPDKTWPALEPDGMYRTPTSAVLFGDVMLTWYVRQGDQPLASTRGQLYDHIGLSVADLDAWAAKLKAENVRFLSPGVERFGEARALMIEGPSQEALMLVEVKP